MRSFTPTFRRIGFVAVTFVAALGFAGAALAQDGTAPSALRIVMTDEFPPFVSSTSDGSIEGERIDMWRLWSLTTGIPVTFQTRPSSQVLGALETGDADIADLVGITPDLTEWLDFGPSYGHADAALFYRTDHPPVRSLAAAKDSVVGVLARSQCHEDLRKAGINTRQFPSLHDLVFTVVIGELPVFCLQTAPAAYVLSQAGLRDDYRQSDPLFTNTLHWTIPKSDATLFKTVEDGFNLIAPSDAAAITERWSGQGPPILGRFRTDQVLRIIGVLAAIVLAAIVTALFLRWRLRQALSASAKIEEQLRVRVREQTCLHHVFLATDDMQRPMPEILRDIAEALHKGFAGSDLPLVRIELLGHIHDEIGARDTADAVTTPIVIEGKEHGRITLLAKPDLSDAGAGLLLGLVASRIAGRALGATTLAMLKKSEERFRRTFQHSAQATAVIQEGRFVNANQAALDLLGYDNGATFLGLTPGDISPRFQPDGELSTTKADRLVDDLMAQGAMRFEWEHLKSNGQSVLLEVLLTGVAEDGRTDIFVLWNDITVKRQAEAALAAYQQTLEAQVAKRTQELTDLYEEVNAIFTTATAGIALIRGDRIVTHNPSLGSILLWPTTERIDLFAHNIFKDPAAWQERYRQASEVISAGGLFEQTVELVRLDGSTIWARLRATAVDSCAPEKGTVWVIEDISAEHAAKTQLANARDLALQAAQLKSEFLAHMSHELRSPINAVLGFTELLMGTDLSSHQHEFMEKVQASGRHLLLIVNDVLDLSKVEAGKLRIEQSEFHLPSVLRSAVDTVSKGAADKNLELLIEIDPTVPRRLIGDPLRIGQILVNYLSNAVKFTPSGTIHVAITPEPALPVDPSGSRRLRFSVSDSGVGMSPEQVTRMFQSFSQAEDSTARLYGGTGLGLSICRQLATLMDGEVGVSSTKDSGTTFWAILPLRAAEAALEPLTDTRLGGKRILLVDDHPKALDQIATDLRRSGATVLCAASGRDAVTVLMGEAGVVPDLIIVDLKMPEMNGVKTIHTLRAKLGSHMPPSILMTKHGGQEMVDLTFAEGIDDLVVKPVDPAVLIGKAEQLLQHGKPRTRAARARSRKPKPATTRAGRVAVPIACRALVIDDNPINRELTAALLGRQGLTVETAENGADGLERLLDGNFDVIFMDNRMPVMGGLEATRRIRALPTAKGRIPIIGLTGRAEEADRQAGIDAGMNDYLIKPVSAAALQATLKLWLDLETLDLAD